MKFDRWIEGEVLVNGIWRQALIEALIEESVEEPVYRGVPDEDGKWQLLRDAMEEFVTGRLPKGVIVLDRSEYHVREVTEARRVEGPTVRESGI